MNRTNKKVFKIIVGGTLILFLLNSKFPYIHMHKNKIKPKITKQIKEDDNRKPLTYVIKGKEINRNDVNKQIDEMQETKSEVQWISIIATFYTASADECGNNRGITASGRKVSMSRGSIAAPYEVPMFSELYIKELGRTFIVEDRGNRNYIKKISNDTIRIDIYVNSKDKAKKLGVKYYKGYFVK